MAQVRTLRYHGLMPDQDTRQADFLPTAGWPALRKRAELLRQTRAFFDARGFLEVETPLLSADTVVDRHLDPFAVTLSQPRKPEPEGVSPRRLTSASEPPLRGLTSPAQAESCLWLQTSPEFAMKRLLAAGGEAIYQITRAFRNGERGRLHNPEFTMVEWYRRGDSYAAGKRLLAELCAELLPFGAPEEISYAEAFRRHVGIDPHAASIEELVVITREKNIATPASMSPTDRDPWLELLLGELVEPQLGVERPAILYDYPASQAALAQVRPASAPDETDNPPVAERFELYVRGIELANGFHELLDPEVLRARNRKNNALRRSDGKPELPEESRLLAAMESGLPDCTGVALGFDRVVMLACGASSVRDVIAFPIDRA